MKCWLLAEGQSEPTHNENCVHIDLEQEEVITQATCD